MIVMKRSIVQGAVCLVGALILAGLGAGLLGLAPQTRAGEREASDVVMLRCDAGGSTIGVSAYVGSTAAPGQKSSNCSESISLLLEEGFAVRDIGHYDQDKKSFLVVTLYR